MEFFQDAEFLTSPSPASIRPLRRFCPLGAVAKTRIEDSLYLRPFDVSPPFFHPRPFPSRNLRNFASPRRREKIFAGQLATWKRLEGRNQSAVRDRNRNGGIIYFIYIYIKLVGSKNWRYLMRATLRREEKKAGKSEGWTWARLVAIARKPRGKVTGSVIRWSF